MLGISATLCPLMSVSTISSSPLALKYSWIIEKKNPPQLLSPYLTYFSFTHNYSRVIYSQDIHIPDLQWHWWLVDDTVVGADDLAWSMEQLILKVSVFSLGPRYRSIPQASCCCQYWSEHLNESLNSGGTSSDQHHCQALTQAFSMWVKHQHGAPSA